MNPLSLFTVFHLNLAYSSIEEQERPEVVRRCYWPLLDFATTCRVPLGIEASGFTLEAIQAIDPRWVARLRELTASGLVEFVGSGYAQIIGPLVPAEVNAANLRLGHATYERLLGARPDIALVNEQAYSAGLLQHYIDAGYRAIIMEWDNPAMHHPEWNPASRYLPQRACGQHGESLPVIWNQSIGFQKFQRFAHGEMDLDELQQYLAMHVVGTGDRAFALYGNDAEIFDYRPKRYHTEAALGTNGEWRRIRQLFDVLAADDRFTFVRPSEVLNLLARPGAGQDLQLESASSPIPVKKQDKYNITRWAVSGRDDIGINTSCWRIFEAIQRRSDTSDDDWRELCCLWSSDFRTHITAARWREYRQRLAACERRWSDTRKTSKGQTKCEQTATEPSSHQASDAPKLRSNRHRLLIETDRLQLVLNCRRGLSIDSLAFRDGSNWRPVCGTLPHGYFDSISRAADYYSGHLVLEAPCRHKITDLDAVEPLVERAPNESSVIIIGKIETPLGPIVKRFRVFEDRPLVEMTFQLEWNSVPAGSLRLGYITLLSTSFDRSHLFFRTHQGGFRPETFRILPEMPFDHGAPVSALVTAHQAVALTRGTIELGDTRGGLRIGLDHTASSLVAMVQYSTLGDSFLCRLCFSAGEMDDTRAGVQPETSLPMQVMFTLSPIAKARKVVRHSAAVLPHQSHSSHSTSHAIHS